jgi:hypothetical protein
MPNLEALRDTYKASESAFHAVIEAEFPGRDEWDWYRACAHMDGDNVRRNDDTTDDAAMASSPAIKAAWDVYIADLHGFYRARDGEHGVLGGRC